MPGHDVDRGLRPDAPLIHAAPVVGRARPERPAEAVAEVEVDGHRLPEHQLAVLEHRHTPVRVQLEQPLVIFRPFPWRQRNVLVGDAQFLERDQAAAGSPVRRAVEPHRHLAPAL